MGIFRRLRSGPSSAASGAQADQKSPSKDPQPSSGQKFVRRTPSLNLLNGGRSRASTASSVPSTPSTPVPPLQPQRTGGSKLPWSSRKKSMEPPSVAYEDTASGPPPRAGFSTPSPSLHSQSGRYTPDPTNIPTIATSSYDSPSSSRYGPRLPSRPPPPSASVHSRPGLAVTGSSLTHTQAGNSGSNGYTGVNVHHHRSPSQATVISIDSTFTAGSRASLEWKQEGGILGKLGFEDDWAAGLGDTLPLENANGQPSAPPQRPKRSDLRDDSGSSTSAAAAAAARTSTSPVKKITTAFSSKTPSSTTNVPAAPLVLSPATYDATEELDSKSSHQGDPEEEKRNRMWTRGRKTSRTRTSDAPAPENNNPPASPPKPPPPRRSTSQTGELAPVALRRPSSNLFHNPFGRTTSRSSLPLDSATGAADDGSFQLKSFRHISGASGTDSKLDQYFNLSRSTSDAPPSSTATTPLTQSPQRLDGPTPGSATHSTPLTAPPPRPRLTSATGSSSSQQNRVSMAEFRKNIRRPSSSMLTDDDDMPLSMSRAQLRAEAAIHRNSSAISLGSDAPSPSPSMTRLMPSVSPMGDKDRKLPSSSPLSRPQSAFLLGANDANNEHAKPRRSSNDPNLTRAKNERTWPDSPTGSNEGSPATSPTTPTGMREPIRGPRRRDSLKSVRKAPPPPPEPHTMPPAAVATANALSQSTSSAKSTFTPLVTSADLEGIKLPPRPDEIPDEPVRGSRPPSRSTTLSPGLTAVLDEPLRRISALWTDNPSTGNDDKEEAFDPAIIAAIGNGPPPPLSNYDRPRTTSESNRVSLYDRLNSVTSAVTSVVPPISIMKGEDPNKLYIPPVPDSPGKRALPQSPASDRTASPVRVAPALNAPPAALPNMPHSSFGRPPRKQPEKVRTRKDAVGWDTSSEDEDDIKKSSPVIAAPRPLKSAMKHPSRTDMLSTSPVPVPAPSSTDDSEPDEPLRQVRARASSRQELRSASRQQEHRPPSRGDMRPTMNRPASRQDMRATAINRPGSRQDMRRPASRQDMRPTVGRPASRQDLRVDTAAAKQAVPKAPSSAGLQQSSRANGGRTVSSSHVSTTSSHTTATPRASGLTPSASKWSLSDSSPTGSEQPSRPPSRPGSRARMNRVASSDRLRAMPGGGVRSSHHQTSPPTGGPLAALNNDTRHSSSPASSQSALTGDSSMQQPSTPRSNTDNRRSWGADARLRASTDAPPETRVRPPSQFDWMNAAGGGVPPGAPYGAPGGMDPNAYAQAQAYVSGGGVGGGEEGSADVNSAMMNKQQFYAQWMAAAQAHFDDAWERASNVSNAQTLPGNNPMMGGMPMGYSYGAFAPPGMAAMQAPPPAMFNMYGGGYGYGMAPPMPFPGGGMSSGMSSASGMGGMGGMGMGGGMYSYAPPAQSVFGGEFGPPVQAPFATEPVSGGGQGGGASGSPSNRRSRLDSAPRPQSIAAGDIATPPRRQQQRRASGMALSEAGGPVSSWRGSRYELNGAEQTPRARRSSHANAS